MADSNSFFKPGNASCPLYRNTRDGEDERHTRARAFLERLWQECGGFLDANAIHHAMADLPSVFWELYLAHALRRAGVNIVEQNRGKKSQRGPDLRAMNPDVWIEAVVAKSGTGDDALEPPQPGVVWDAPVESFILRLRSVIETKAEMMKRYIAGGVISGHQPAVVAISGCMLSTWQWTEPPIPRIVQAALGVGYLNVEISRSAGATIGHSVQYNKDEARKVGGAVVKTDVFLGPQYAHVSALIYSCADWVNTPHEPGKEFIVVHNENATAKLPRGWLPVGDEYWLEGDAVSLMRQFSDSRVTNGFPCRWQSSQWLFSFETGPSLFRQQIVAGGKGTRSSEFTSFARARCP